MSSLSVDMEIRKLMPNSVKELADILDKADSWKILMSLVPSKLERNCYECDITRTNPPKYNSGHFRKVVEVSEKLKISCTGILLDDWGTSGRVRPTLGHLLHLLKKAKLGKAAAYVSIKLLGQKPPETPSPDLDAEVHKNPAVRNEGSDEFERLLDELNYPATVIKEIEKNNNNNNRVIQKVNTPMPPEIVIIESPDEEQNEQMFYTQNEEMSDMMKFSTDNITTDNNISATSGDLNNESSIVTSNEIPQLSLLMNNNESSERDKQIVSSSPSLQSPDQDQSSEIDQSTDSDVQVPHLSELLINGSSSSDVLPNISAFNHTNSIISDKASSSLPNFAILTSSDDSTSTLNQSSRKSSRACVSPLPNLSLNTKLPHFTYTDLLEATNDFDLVPYDKEQSRGSFLGSGAYGSVFLAKGLLSDPVAVKKLKLANLEVVNVDDLVTKQFKNEVEVLSNYKHKNLLTLLGYSCDGCTYCLVYEYVSGGALKNRLEVTDPKLMWKDRLKISLGTSQAVAYLHTAFSSPLIHRDIKTANILLDADNTPKLCDFGLIKLMKNQHTISTTTAHGTSAYMSPEAFRGDISVKMDTFSFGVVLLELLTSLPPLDENREGCDLVTHIEEMVEQIGSVDSLVDKAAGSWDGKGVNFAEELYKIASKCLDEKKKRPTMVDVVVLLEELCRKI